MAITTKKRSSVWLIYGPKEFVHVPQGRCGWRSVSQWSCPSPPPPPALPLAPPAGPEPGPLPRGLPPQACRRGSAGLGLAAPPRMGGSG